MFPCDQESQDKFILENWGGVERDAKRCYLVMEIIGSLCFSCKRVELVIGGTSLEE